MEDFLYKFIVSIVPIIFAITVHEAAHGWTAKKYGDLTAHNLGRITLNPKSHIDPIGTIAVPILLYITSGFAFGWAKPVPVNFSKLNNPKKDMAIVALAGPLSNFIMAIIWTIIFVVSGILGNLINLPMFKLIVDMSLAGFYINIFFMLLNLIPILPLDGGRILDSFLPNKISHKMQALETYGIFIIIGLAMTGILNQILNPLVKFFYFLIFAPAIRML